MGIGPRYVDFDKYLESLNGNFIYLNDLDPEQDLELIKRLTLSIYDSQEFSLIPSCNCGATTLETHPHKKVGDLCEYCFTEIAVQSSRRLKPTIWIRPPDGIKSMINPAFLDKLVDAYRMPGQGTNKPSLIHWLFDPYDQSFTIQSQIDHMVRNGVKRGFSYFLEHADEIMELLQDDYVFTKRYQDRKEVYALYRRFKDKLFPHAIPIVDKSFNIVENSNLGSLIDGKSFNSYTNIINTLLSLRRLKTTPSLSKKNNVVAKVLFGLNDYYNEDNKINNGKKGRWRKHVFGSRFPWTSRMVITSLHGIHDWDEVHFPWSAAIALYEVHLTNYMLKDGYKPNEIKDILLSHVHKYDPYIDSLFDRMFEESPYRTTLSGKKGLPIIENRNPSLKLANIQQLYITKIKKDPSDISKSISIFTLAGFGGDRGTRGLIANFM